MNTTDNQHYQADKGCFIVRKSDQVIMGEAIDLGSDDNIKNYAEEAFTEEKIAQLHKEWGAEQPEPLKRGRGK